MLRQCRELPVQPLRDAEQRYGDIVTELNPSGCDLDKPCLDGRQEFALGRQDPFRIIVCLTAGLTLRSDHFIQSESPNEPTFDGMRQRGVAQERQ